MDVTHLKLPYFGQRRLSFTVAAGVAFVGGCYIAYHLARSLLEYPPIPAEKRCYIASCSCPKHEPESYWKYMNKLERMNEKRKGMAIYVSTEYRHFISNSVFPDKSVTDSAKRKAGVNGLRRGHDLDVDYKAIIYDDEEKDISYKFPVEVFIRIRPLVGKEVEEGHEPINYTVKTSKKKGTKTLVLKKESALTATTNNNDDGDDEKEMSAVQKRLQKRLKSRNRDVKYQGFKHILEPTDNNFRVFARCIGPALPAIMKGDKTCVFAYGHTGSGKTHTICGYPPDRPGLFQSFASQLIGNILDTDAVFVEEMTKDGLLTERLVTSIRVNNLDDLLKVIADGINSRKCGLSTLHDKSSRSHAFLEFELVNTELVELRNKLVQLRAEKLYQHLLQDAIREFRERLPAHKGMAEHIKIVRTELKEKPNSELSQRTRSILDAKYDKRIRDCEENIDNVLNDKSHPFKECIGGTMCFVDLAGNEYGRDVKNKDKEEERERNDINKSLLALKECIRALHNKKRHVGYRSSKLTQYLKKYLGGDGAHAIMINCIGSSKEYQKQSVNTLQYAAYMAKI